MPEYAWSQFAATAKAASGGPTLPEADGYVSEIVDAGAKEASGKPTRFWWKHKILVGPNAGDTEMQSQPLIPSNPNALAMFYRVLADLGINLEEIPDNTPPAAVAKTAVGRRFSFDFKHRVDTKDKSANPRKFAQFDNLQQLEVVTAPAAPPAAPPVSAPVAVEAAQAPDALAGVTAEQVAAFLAAQAPTAEAPVAPAAPKSNVPF